MYRHRKSVVQAYSKLAAWLNIYDGRVTRPLIMDILRTGTENRRVLVVWWAAGVIDRSYS